LGKHSISNLIVSSGNTCTALTGHTLSIDQVPGAGADAIGEITDGHTNADVPQSESAEKLLENSAQHCLRIQINLQGSPVSREDLSGEEAAPFRGSRGDGSDIQTDDVSVRAEKVPDNVSEPVVWHG
jgi:hypothetical protein